MHSCKNSPNVTCYVCGIFTSKNQIRPISKLMKTAYQFYFGCPLGDQVKKQVPHIMCIRCYVKLMQ